MQNANECIKAFLTENPRLYVDVDELYVGDYMGFDNKFTKDTTLAFIDYWPAGTVNDVATFVFTCEGNIHYAVEIPDFEMPKLLKNCKMY